MINLIKEIYNNEQFNPKLLGIFINPFYFARKGLYLNIEKYIGSLNGRLLDIGCGSKPYQEICKVTEYIGLEIDDEGNRNHVNADVFYDGKRIPFEDNFFNSVMSNQVFEHVFNPEEFLIEIRRVLRKDGLFLMTVPFVWDEHEQPYDFARYSSFGLKYILCQNGFEILSYSKSTLGVEVIFQLINAYIYKVTLTRFRILNLLCCIFLISPVNLFGLVLSKLLPKNKDLYLNNVILVKKL